MDTLRRIVANRESAMTKLTNFINKKGKRYDYKLHYEELPSAPKVKRKPKTTEKNTKSNILDGNIILGFIHLVPFVFQRKSSNRLAVLSNIDDREAMPKMPQTRKAKPKKKARG